MATINAIEVYEKAEIENFETFVSQIYKWSSLWWGDFEEACIDRCYIAFDGDDAIGFQTVDRDGLCVAIEVKAEYQGKGIASMLVEESGCWKPDRNECPEFWESMKKKFGY